MHKILIEIIRLKNTNFLSALLCYRNKKIYIIKYCNFREIMKCYYINCDCMKNMNILKNLNYYF